MVTMVRVVSCFPYIGSITNEDNSISEEITHSIKKGNRTYYAHKGLITSKLINKYTEGAISMTLIRPVMTYACITLTLSVRDINNLLVLKGKIKRHLDQCLIRKMENKK
jgi:hypothetical protein